LAGIVLAGGKSARMGMDKARLNLNNMPLLAHVVTRLKKVVKPVIVVAAVKNQYSLTDGTRVIGDIFPDAGPLGGVVTGLTAVEEGYHFIAACDMPCLRSAVIRLLLEEARGADGAVPEIEDRLEPLCAVYHTRCAEPLRACLESGTRALHHALQTLNLKSVSEETIRAVDKNLISFTNVNTPEEFKALFGYEPAIIYQYLQVCSFDGENRRCRKV
jgi:molybdopterin-guanine dinucleotide biosynthesis protein A